MTVTTKRKYTKKVNIVSANGKEMEVNFRGLNVRFNLGDASLSANLNKKLNELPDQNNLHKRILLEIIEQLAKEIKRFESKTSNLDYIQNAYNEINCEFKNNLNTPIDLTDEAAVKEHYFDLRDSMKKSVQLLKYTELRLQLRMGAPAPSENKYELYE